MSTSEAVELLLYSSNDSAAVTDQVRKDALTIAQELGCLPIALQQARSYMKQTKCSAAEYLRSLSRNWHRLLGQMTKQQLDMASISTYAACATSFNELEAYVQRFMRLVSHFHWGNFPLELVVLAAEHQFSEYELENVAHDEDYYTAKTILEGIFLRDGEWDVTVLDDLTMQLQNYSLATITSGVDTRLLQLHPLVHEWVRSCIPKDERSEYQSASVTLLALGARLDYTVSMQYLGSHATHMSQLWDRLHVNNAAAFGLILRRNGVSQGALRLQKRAVRELRGKLDTDDFRLADSIEGLALAYSNLGQPEDAEMLQEEVLKLRREILGEHHPDTITALSNLGVTYSDLGRFNEAKLLNEEVLELAKKTLGERNPTTLDALTNLACTYSDLGRPEEAKELQEEALKLRKEVLGERHPSTINALTNLATTYFTLERLEDAKVLQEKALELNKEMLGERHPSTISALSNLASTYSALGRPKEAEVLHERALELSKEVIGKRHPDTLSMSINLAVTYCHLGRLEEAKALEEEVLELRKEVLGERHPDTISSLSRLATACSDLGRPEEAVVLKERVLELRKQVLGERHLDTVTASSYLANTYYELERFEEAKVLREEVLELRKEILGERHPETIIALSNLSATYVDLERLEEAATLEEEVLKWRKEVLGERHQSTTTARLILADIYNDLGKTDAALELVLVAEGIVVETLGVTHLQYSQCQKLKETMQSFDDSDDWVTASGASEEDEDPQPGFIS